MKIYENQVEELGRNNAVEYERRVIEFVRDQLAGGAAREVDRLEIRRIIVEAHEAGLETERQVVAYVAGTWLYGDTFLARMEPLRERFVDMKISPDAKAQLVLDVVDELEKAAAPR